MKKITVLFLSALFVMGLTSCKKDATFISTAFTSLSVDKEGGEYNIAVTSDGDWDVSTTKEWIQAVKDKQTLHVTVKPNTDMTLRQGDIILKSGKTVVMINVIQAYICTKIIPDQTELTFEKEGGTQTVGIDTDGGNIQIDCPDGFAAVYADGNLTVTAEAVTGSGTKGEITLSCDDQTATISLKQKGDVCERCGGSGKIKCPDCHGRGMYSERGSFVTGEAVDWNYSCEKCGGDGMRVPWQERMGSGRITCPNCGGSGR